MLADLQPVEDIDLSLSGFSEDELGKLLKSLDVREKRERPESFDLDAALEAARAATRAKRGELWALGDHRLLIGDATDAGDVARLLGETRPAMCFTDPPYNVALGDHGGQQRGQRRRRIANDALPPEQWEAFVRGWARNLVASVDGALYVCMSTKEWPSVSPRARRGRRPLVRHDHLGEGPLRPRPRRLPAAVRADLVRLARRREAPLVRRPRPGRRLADRPAVRVARRTRR